MKRLFSALLAICLIAVFFPTVSLAEEASFGKVEYWRLILKEDIGFSFQLSFSPDILSDENARVQIQMDEKTTEVPVAHCTESLCVSVAPAQMHKEITLSVVSGLGSCQQMGSYSVKAYADEILSGNYDNATKNLVKAMLTYGAAAQNFFGVNPQSPANAGIDFPLAEMPQNADDRVTGYAEGILFYGASLRYDHQTALRYYFQAETLDGYRFTANGRTVQPSQKDGLYYIEISQILPQQLDAYFCIRVTDPQGSTMQIEYNPADYVVRMYHKETASQGAKELLQALYTYHLVALSYSN